MTTGRPLKVDTPAARGSPSERLDRRSTGDLSAIVGSTARAAGRRARSQTSGVRVDLDELRISRAAVVTVAQAASVFGVDVRTVTRAIEKGELPAVRLGRRVLIPRLPLLATLGVSDDDALTEVHNAATGDG